MLELKNIHKSFKIRDDKSQHVLKNLSATFPSHGFVTILGASGNGKTTVLNILGGLDTPNSGEVYFNNEKITDFETFRREKVSFIFQDLNLIPHLNALDNVILGISDELKNKKEKAKEILLSLGLEESLYKRPDQLSGGQQQRVAIARTIAKNVDIIICDEPTGSLDNDTKKIITDILKELSNTKLVIFITHNLDLAHEYSDMIFETIDGQLINHSHLAKADHFKTDSKKRVYDANVTWLAFKNIIGRYKHTIRYSLFIIFIMLIASTAIVIQGEYVKKYIHDISLDTGIKSIRVDYKRPENHGSFDALTDLENIEALSFMYNTQIRLTTGRILENAIVVSSDLVQIEDDQYFEDILVAGRMPESKDEVIMTPGSIIDMLTGLGVGGQRLKDQYATGELDANEIFDLIDLSPFTVFEKGWPKFKVVGIIDDTKIYEEKLTLYVEDGFTDLFEYTSRDRVSYIELPKHLDLSKIILYKDNVYRESHDQLADILESNGYKIDQHHEKKVNATYNKIDSFFSLSVVFLYVIIGIASISFISLLSASIFERKYEIGLYRTKGYTKLNIMKILGLEMYFLGFLSLLVTIVILLVTAIIMYFNIEYITSFAHVFEIINIPVLALALLGIITVFVLIIVYISNTIILRESVLSNIKDTGHNKKSIKKQVAIVLILFTILGIAQVANKKYDILDGFKSEPIDTTLYENRDDFSTVEKSGIFELYDLESLEDDLNYLAGKLYTHTHLNTDYNVFLESHEYAKSQLFDGMTKLEYMRLIKPMIASLNCVNSNLTFNDDYSQVKVFADNIFASKGKLYLKDNSHYLDIPKSSEILSINGLEASVILEKMLTSIPSEGTNETYKYFVINNDFPLNYLISVAYTESFDVHYKSPKGQLGSTVVSAIPYEEIEQPKEDNMYSKAWTDTYALLTIQSFSPIENDYMNSIRYMDNFFETLKEKNLDYLILDLRGCHNGQVKIAAHLLSYLQDEPSRFLGTDETIIEVAKNNFDGSLLVLQDGGTGTLAGQLLSILKDKDIGYYIGEETSSASLTSSQVNHFNLANTNIGLSIATELANARASQVSSGQGLKPDYEITKHIEDVTNENDVVLNLATHLIDRELAVDDFSNLKAEGLFKTYTKKALLDDFESFKSLLNLQPHVFTDEDLLSQLIDGVDEKLFDGMTQLEFLRVLQPIAAAMNDHQTKLSSSDDMKDVKMFADKIYAEENKLYLGNNTFYSEIPVGSQITSINGRAAEEIIDSLCNVLSTDKENETYKYHLINEDFGTYYLKYVEYLEYFDIKYITPDGIKETASVPAIDGDTISNHRLYDIVETSVYELKEDYAIMRIHTFSPSITRGLDTFFKAVKEKNINYIILDLRGNAGGDIKVSEAFQSYLIPDHPNQAEYAYDGELLVLQDGSITSTAGQFIASLKNAHVGTMFGEASASASTISKDVESTVLDNSGLIFNYATDISTLETSDEGSKGVIPDYVVKTNITDVVNKNDTLLTHVMDILNLKIFHGEFYNSRMEGLFEVYSKEAITKDFEMVVDTLRNMHTNLYTDEALFNELSNSIRNKLHDNMTKLEFIRLVSPLVASTNCWQTSISFNIVDQEAKSLGGAYSKDVYDSTISVFADKLYIQKGKLYLTDNVFYDSIPIGSEILSINNRTTSEILDTLMAYVPSDGNNQTLKYKILNTNFSWYYFLYLENTDKFSVVYKRPNGTKGTKTVPAVGLNDISQMYPSVRTYNEPVIYQVYDDYGYLDINTFNLKNPLKQKNYMYALYDFFMELKVKDIKNVILDLRGNHGGEPTLAANLLTYLQPEPRRYWSENSADETELSSPLVNSPIHYSGKLYVLMDGESISTTGHLLALLKYHDIATFIGQESGSTYLNSENTETISLTNTSIKLTYTTQIYEVDAPGLDPGIGIKPDYEIIPTLNDRMNNHDPVLDFTRRLIN